MSIHDQTYGALLHQILTTGVERENRTGINTLSVFGTQHRYDLNKGFPLLTTKKVHFKSILVELLWFLQGNTNIQYLNDNGVTIWNEWADEKGDLGPVYGRQWRSWPFGRVSGYDQIATVIRDIKETPDSRRLIVSSWNVDDLSAMALPPCHLLFQFYVHDGKLSCQLYQRSADVFLGVPFNIASYALLTHMVAQVCGLQVGEFVHTIGDAHLYINHLDQAREQLSRDALISPPTLYLNPSVSDIDEFEISDVVLYNYQPLPAIKAEVAV